MEAEVVERRYAAMPKISQIFDVSPATVRRLRKTKGFPGPIFLGSNCARYDLGEVDRWFAARKSQAA